MFYFLPQPVHMRLQRVCRHPRVVSPHLFKQDIPCDDLAARTVKIFDYCDFLLGQPYLAAFGVDQHLLPGLERIGPDNESRVLALFMLAELCPNARQQDRKAKRLGHIVVCARIRGQEWYPNRYRAPSA